MKLERIQWIIVLSVVLINVVLAEILTLNSTGQNTTQNIEDVPSQGFLTPEKETSAILLKGFLTLAVSLGLTATLFLIKRRG